MPKAVDDVIKRIKALTCFDGYICSIEQVYLGLSHHCFIVTVVNYSSQKSTKYFVKLLSMHCATEKNERLVAQSSALLKLSPNVIFHSKDWLVTEYIEGYSLLENNYSLEDKISVAMKLLHEFHQLSPIEQVSSLSLKLIINELIEQSSLSNIQQSFLTRLSQQITAFEQVSEPVICHGDFNFSNILIDKQAKAWLVDFECSSIGCAEYDVAMFIAINNLSNNHISYTLQCYQEESKKIVQPKLVQHYLGCCYLINGLWYQEQSKTAIERDLYIDLAYQQYRQFDQLKLSESKLIDKLL
jgi:thiamine kinase-like enzyme